MAVVSISLPDAVLDRLDSFVAARGFAGRSEAVRASLRELMRETSERRGRRAATLTLVYEEGQERRIAEIKHDHSSVVKSMMHNHADGRCVEMILLEGDAAEIRRLADRLRSRRETVLAELVFTDVGDA
ncbi:MAG TPA: CopG family ribbon-helix-helix protein [Candidatus Thermoplasmatota archaeon]|nr:CopG family ribbon-helix-helix protein [Candidatus Thermoplasmatota archaeon]